MGAKRGANNKRLVRSILTMCTVALNLVFAKVGTRQDKAREERGIGVWSQAIKYGMSLALGTNADNWGLESGV